MEKIASCCQNTVAMLAYDVTWCSDLIPPISQTGLPPEGGFELHWEKSTTKACMTQCVPAYCREGELHSIQLCFIRLYQNNFELLAGIMFFTMFTILVCDHANIC